MARTDSIKKLLRLYPVPSKNVHLNGLYLAHRVHELGRPTPPFILWRDIEKWKVIQSCTWGFMLALSSKASTINANIAFFYTEAFNDGFLFQFILGVACTSRLPDYAWQLHASIGRKTVGQYFADHGRRSARMEAH